MVVERTSRSSQAVVFLTSPCRFQPMNSAAQPSISAVPVDRAKTHLSVLFHEQFQRSKKEAKSRGISFCKLCQALWYSEYVKSLPVSNLQGFFFSVCSASVCSCEQVVFSSWLVPASPTPTTPTPRARRCAPPHCSPELHFCRTHGLAVAATTAAPCTCGGGAVGGMGWRLARRPPPPLPSVGAGRADGGRRPRSPRSPKWSAGPRWHR